MKSCQAIACAVILTGYLLPDVAAAQNRGQRPSRSDARPASTTATGTATTATVSTWLETQFTELIRPCAPTPLKLRGGWRDGDTEIPSVPLDLSQLYSSVATQPYEVLDGDSLAQLFLRVYEPQTNLSYTRLEADLPVAAETFSSRATNANRNNVTFSYDCLGAIVGATRAGGQLTLGPAELQAAIQASVSGSASRNIGLISGEFVSELPRRMSGVNSDGNAEIPFYYQASLWDWYREHPGRIGKTNSVIRVLRGITIYDFTNARQTREGIAEGAMRAGGNVGVASGSAEANTRGELRTGTSLSASNYRSIAFQTSGLRGIEYDDLPSMTQIAALMRSAPSRLTVPPDGAFTIFSDGPSGWCTPSGASRAHSVA